MEPRRITFRKGGYPVSNRLSGSQGMAGQEPEFDGQLPQPAGKAIDLEKRLQQKTQGRPEPGPPAGGARLPNCLPDFCPGSFLSPSSYPFLSSAGRTGFSSVAEKEHRKKTGPPPQKPVFQNINSREHLKRINSPHSFSPGHRAHSDSGSSPSICPINFTSLPKQEGRLISCF